MLEPRTAELILQKLQPLIGHETVIVDPVGRALAGGDGTINLLTQNNLVPFYIGRVTMGYVIPPDHLADHERLFSFVQTIAELVAVHHTAIETTLVGPSGNEEFSQDETDLLDALFSSDLNVTQAAARLGLHRNTLGYRISKLADKHRLDPKMFSDASIISDKLHGPVVSSLLPMGLLSDDVLLTTLKSFLRSNLDVNQTAARLGIHRNTLNYRLDKIRKATSLNPRNFQEARIIQSGLH